MEPKFDWILMVLLAACLLVYVAFELRHPTHCSYLHRGLCPNGLHGRMHL